MPRTKGTRGPGRPRKQRVAVVEPDGEVIVTKRPPVGKVIIGLLVAVIILGIVHRVLTAVERLGPTPAGEPTDGPAADAKPEDLGARVEAHINGMASVHNQSMLEITKTFQQVTGEFNEMDARLSKLETLEQRVHDLETWASQGDGDGTDDVVAP